MAQRVNKICPGCNTVFQGSDSAKTCSARCRKRIQRAKVQAEQELSAVKGAAEELAHKIEVRVEPSYATEGGYIDLGTKEVEDTEHRIRHTDSEIENTPAPFDNKLHPWQSDGQKTGEASIESTDLESKSVGAFNPPVSQTLSTFQPEVSSPVEEVKEKPSPEEQPASNNQTTIVHHHHYAAGDWPKALAVIVAVLVMAGSLFFLINRSNHQAALNQQNQNQAIQQLAQTLGSSPIKSQPDATKINFNVDTVISKGAKLTATGQVAIQNEADSTHAFTVQNSSGKSVLTTDTANGRVGIGQDPTGSAALQVGGDITASGSIVSTGGTISLDSSGLTIGGTLVCTSNGCISSAKPAIVQPQTIDLADVAFLDHDQTLSGSNTFSGNNAFTGSNSFKTATFTGPFQVQNTNGSALIATNNSKVGIGTTPSASGAAFQVGGDVNVSGVYRVGNNSGANLSCPAGDIIGSPVIIGGIIIGGTCQVNLAGAVPTFQQVYNASTDPHITLNSASGTLTVQDAATPLGINLFVVQGNGGSTKYFAVNTNGAQVVGDVDITGQFKVNGSPLSSSVLADTSNLAKLNATQTFSGANTFSNAANSFSGDGSGLANVNASQLNGQGGSYYTNASNLSSGNLNDARLSNNVALKNATQTFSGANTFSNSSNSFTGNGSGLTSLNGSNISSGTVADARLSSNVALKNADNTFTGNNTFALSTGPLQIQDAATPLGTNLFEITDNTGATTYFAVSATGAMVNGQDVCTKAGNCAGVGGDVTSSGGTTNHLAKFSAGNAIADSLILDDGTSVTIGGDLAANNITQNGHTVCDTSGNCVGGGGAGSAVGGSGNTNKVALFTAAGTIGDSILSQSGTTVTAGGNINATGQYQINGSQVSSSILSNDGNLAKLDADQTFSGVNLFNNADNVLVGDGSGLTALNGSNISSGTVGDAYLSNNVALLDANQTFSGANTFSNASNSFTGDGSNLTNLNGSNVASGTVADARLSNNVALLNANQTASGNKTFTGTVAVNDTGISAFSIQNASASGNLFVADTTDSKVGIGTAPSSSGATLQVAGNVSSTTGFIANGNTGSSVTCTSGNVLQNAIITGGIITGGTCVANGAGVSVSLQQVYDSSSPAVITLDSTNGGVAIKDNAAPIGSNLFTVEDNSASTKYLNVTSSGVTASNLTVANSATVTGITTLNGSVLAKNSADSTSAFQIQNAAGTTTILGADTSNKLINIDGGATYNTYSATAGSGFGISATYGYTSPYSMAAADFNGDGYPDLVTTNTSSAIISVFMGNGDGTLNGRTDYATASNSTYGITAADLNGDGKPDIAATNYSSNTISVFLNNGDGTFAQKVDYPSDTGGSPYGITTADFNGDGKIDIAVLNQNDHTVSVFTNNGDGTFGPKTSYAVANVYGVIAAADFNGDGKQDIVATYPGNPCGVDVMINNGYGFNPAVSYSFSSCNGTLALTTGDFNGDGRPDIAVTGGNNSYVFIFLNNGDGSFAAYTRYSISVNQIRAIIAADFNGDGKIDLAFADSFSNSVSTLTGNGNGTFGSLSTYSIGTSSRFSGMTADDFNSDGKLDLVTGDTTNKNIYVLINGATTVTTNHSGALGIASPDGGTTGLIIQGAVSQTADLLRLQNASSTELLAVSNSGVLETSSIDGLNGGGLSIGATAYAGISLQQNTTIAANKSLSSSGSVTFADATNSTTAFQVQNSAGMNLLTADTANLGINVTGANLLLNGVTPTNLVASAGVNSSGNFSGANGGIYYYEVTAIVNGQETTPSNQISFSSSNFNPTAAPSTAPTLTLTTGSTLGVGTYQYEVTYVTANGETTGGTSASITTTSGNQAINLSAVPTGPTGTTSRKIYRTVVGGSTYKLLTTIADNSTTTYSDTTTDASLGATVPGSNTARTNTNSINLSWTAVPGATSYRIYRGTSSGGESAYQTSSVNGFTDSGSSGTSATPPTLSPFGRIGIGTSSPAASLDVRGTALYKNSVDSTIAFQVQNASGNNMVQIDTANSKLYLGAVISSPDSSTSALRVNSDNQTSGYAIDLSHTNSNGGDSASGLRINTSNTIAGGASNSDVDGSGLSIVRNIATFPTSIDTALLDTSLAYYQSGTSMSQPLTVGTNTDKYLLVEISGNNNVLPTSVTYNGVALSLVGSIMQNTNQNIVFYGLVNPAGGTHNIQLTYASTQWVAVVASSWYNVNQSLPTGTFVSGTNVSSINVTTSVNQVVADGINKQYTPAAGQTLLGTTCNPNVGGSCPNNYLDVAASYQTATGTNTVMGWSATGTVLAAVPLNSATAVHAAANISGNLSQITSNCTVNDGTCTDTSTLLNINQQYSGATGTVFNIQNAGSGAGLNVQNAGGSNLFTVGSSSVTAEAQTVSIGSGTGNHTINIGNGGPTSFPQNAVIDNFNRTNNATLGSNWSGPVFQTNSSTWQVNSNEALDNHFGSATDNYRTDISAADTEAYFTIVSTTGEYDVMARVQSPNTANVNAYLLDWDSGTSTLQLYKSVNNTVSAIGSPATLTQAIGNQMGIRALGSTITGYVNTGSGWVQEVQATDYSIAGAGTIGISAASQNDMIDDFGGGALTNLTQNVTVGTTYDSSSLLLQAGAGNVTIKSSASTIVQSAGDSATAFQIQNSSGSALFVADTSGMKITVTGSLSVSGNLAVGGYLITDGGMYATSLPASPVNGQEVYYEADSTNGVVWHLRYDTSLRSGSGAWAFLGGSPLDNEIATDDDQTVGTTYQDLTNVGPTITLPLSGTYDISVGAELHGESGTGAMVDEPVAVMSYDIGGAGASDTDAIYGVPIATGSQYGQSSVSRTERKTGIVGPVTITSKYKRIGGSNSPRVSAQNRYLRATPVFVY